MSQLDLEISPWHVVWPRVVMVAGLGLVFAPLNVAAYLYTPHALRGAAVGLLALLRNEGGSVGTSMGQTITERREIFHALPFNEHLDPLNPRREFLYRPGPVRIPAADSQAWRRLLPSQN
jgi:DHA2 family multidrug resistance protein